MSQTNRIPKAIREAKLKQCPFCAICHTTGDLELNHVDPEGPSTIDNLVVLCSKCHTKWHDMKEGSRHADLIRKGIQRANESGVHFGKKPADYENVMRLIAEHSTQFNDIYSADYYPYTENEIMEMAGVKSVCYHKCKRMLLTTMEFETWPYSWNKPKVYRNVPLYEYQIVRLRGK